MTRRATVALVVLVGLTATPAAASWGRLSAPLQEAVLVAGELAPLRWNGLPAAVDEFELLLSVDDGRSFPIRLTPQLDPRLDSYTWRVPNLPVPAARMRLRVGLEGREIDGPIGPRFAIVATALEPVAGFEQRAGEWWLVMGSAADLAPLQPESRLAERAERTFAVRAATLVRQPSLATTVSTARLAVRPVAVTAGSDAVRVDHRPPPATHLRP